MSLHGVTFKKNKGVIFTTENLKVLLCVDQQEIVWIGLNLLHETSTVKLVSFVCDPPN
jgi:hypothetical protein